MRPIHILMVDDNPLFIETVARFLAVETRVNVVGRAFSGREALAQVATLQPDLVLMDYMMPDMNGIEATRQIKTQPEAPRVVILTMHNLPDYQAQVEAVGADGFVAKADFGEEFLPLLDTMFPGPAAPAPAEQLPAGDEAERFPDKSVGPEKSPS